MFTKKEKEYLLVLLNTELKDIVPVKDFDFDKFLEEWIKKNTKPKTLWDKISQFFRYKS